MRNGSGKGLSKAIIFYMFRFLTPLLKFLVDLNSRKRWNRYLKVLQENRQRQVELSKKTSRQFLSAFKHSAVEYHL